MAAELVSASGATTGHSPASDGGPELGFRSKRRSQGIDPSVTVTGDPTAAYTEFRSAGTRRSRAAEADKGLVERAIEILENVDPKDGYESTLSLGALRSIVYQLWKSVAECSLHHQATLAILERAVLSTTELDGSRVSAFREALIDLANPALTDSHVEMLRSHFIDLRSNALAALGDLAEGDENDEHCPPPT